jgi:hypothetical protein
MILTVCKRLTAGRDCAVPSSHALRHKENPHKNVLTVLLAGVLLLVGRLV